MIITAVTATAVAATVTMDMAIGTATKTCTATGIGMVGIGGDMATVAIGMVDGGATALARAGDWFQAAGFGSATEGKGGGFGRRLFRYRKILVLRHFAIAGSRRFRAQLVCRKFCALLLELKEVGADQNED